jgi:hypothetical protein
VIRAKIFSRDTGVCEVVFHEEDRYEIFAEHECWVPTLKRWERTGVILVETDEEGDPDWVEVHMVDENFPQALKKYVERQFNCWHVEVVAP